MSLTLNPIKKALISVSDKTGLDTLGQFLKEQNVAIYSTGGTADFLRKLGVTVTQVDEVTQYPEMLGGRVKTLHPRVFGGVLARRHEHSDMKECEKFEIPLFDLVVVNLYPFQEHLGESPYEQSSFIDIGGPSLIRAASKNSRSVTVLSDPSDYDEFIQEAKRLGGTTGELRHKFASRSFQRTSAYDAMIAQEWSETKDEPVELCFSRKVRLRYGENPHQQAFWSNEKANWKCLQGKELSYNNLLDAEAALRAVSEFADPAVVIVKHNNPCGVATGRDSIATIYKNAFSGDPKSAFGGVIAVNRPLDQTAATEISQTFSEVILAPHFDEGARKVFDTKKNLRLLEWENPQSLAFEVRAALGGWLVQTQDTHGIPTRFEEVTIRKIDPAVKSDLIFAWLVCKHARSNAIVLARDGKTIGIGAGQMSRVDAVNIALQKSGESTPGAVLASDAFFPFRDNIDLLKGKGISAIIQPGGSQRDGEVIQACNELGIAMVFTGERHFRH